jgi:fibronectin type 3 domain-containing protein
LSIALSGTGAAATTYTVGLAWTAGSSATGFNIYRGTTSGGPYTKLNASALSAASYSDSSVTAGQTYYYVATDLNSSGEESTYSNQVTAAIP